MDFSMIDDFLMDEDDVLSVCFSLSLVFDSGVGIHVTMMSSIQFQLHSSSRLVQIIVLFVPRRKKNYNNTVASLDHISGLNYGPKQHKHTKWLFATRLLT